MNIAISGATGTIGRHLTAHFTAHGHHVVALGRPLFRENMIDELRLALSHCQVVINLAGASIAKRWTAGHRNEVLRSRVRVTRCLIQALKTTTTTPQLFISASAVGCYPWSGVSDEATTERANGFLSDVCMAWEKEAKHCPKPVRLVITRFGLVLSPDGGVMQQMLLPIQKAKIAVGFGPGLQPFPWISMNDLCRSMDFIIDQTTLCGVVNLVTPQSVSQREFVRALGRAYGAWFTVMLPSPLMRLLMGEQASMFTQGQVVRPTRLLEAGFKFVAPTLADFLGEQGTKQKNGMNASCFL